MERRNLRAQSDRAQRLERRRIERGVDLLDRRWGIHADISSSLVTLNTVYVPTNAPAAPPDLLQIYADVRKYGARPHPDTSQNKLYLAFDRQNDFSDRAVGIFQVIAGLLIALFGYYMRFSQVVRAADEIHIRVSNGMW